MFGEEVDISTRLMNARQRAWFENNAASKQTRTREYGILKAESAYGFARCIPEPEENPHHYHCSVVRA